MLKKQQVIIGHFRQGKSKKQLSKELKISRNTVRKYIEQYEQAQQECTTGSSAKEIEKGILVPPKYDSIRRSKRRLTQEIADLIERYLAQNQTKRETGLSKQQMKKTDIHEALLEAGHTIGYTTVCNYVRTVEQKQKEAFIRQQYAAGQVVEFDWGEVKLRINGVEKKLMLAVFTSAYSNHRWARLYYRQDMSSFLHSHACYFEAVGGVSQQVVYDNMRVAVRKYTLRNKDKLPTEELLRLSTYYQFDYRFCNARKGNEKGHVERSVEYIRRKAFARQDEFSDLQSGNEHLAQVNQKLNQKSVKGKTKSIIDHFEEELRVMRPSPKMYDTAMIESLRVDKYSCIKVDTNYYSVEEGHVGAMLQTRIYPDYLQVYNAHNQGVATHQRQHTRYQYYLKIEHFLKTLRTKPGALLGSLTLVQADQQLQQIFHQHFEDAPKAFIELLIFLKKNTPEAPHGYSIEAAQRAIDQCVESCPHHPICLDKIKILLAQSSSHTPTASDAPSAAASSVVDEQEMSSTIAQFCNHQLKDIQSLMHNN